MQFAVRSPLAPSECTSRLARALEGPIPKPGSKLTGWHVFGKVKPGHIEATIVGVKVGPDGKKRPSLWPLLQADLSQDRNETLVKGEVASRYGGRSNPVNTYIAPVVIAACALWTVASLSTRWPILVFDLALAGMLAFSWLSRMRMSRLRHECESELCSWLERTVEGKRDESPTAGD